MQCYSLKKEEGGDYDFFQLYNWIERKSLSPIHDLESETGWHTIIDSYSQHLVLFVNTRGGETEKNKNWVKRFEKIANYINDHDLISLCDMAKPKCQEFIKLLGVHNRKFDPLSIAYVFPLRDKQKHFRLFEPLSIPFLEIDTIIKYIEKCKGGKGSIDHTTFISEAEEQHADSTVYKNVNKLVYKSLINKLKNQQNDILIFIRHKEHENMAQLDQAFSEVAGTLKSHAKTEFYHYNLDLNSVHGLTIKTSPVIRIYKVGKVLES